MFFSRRIWAWRGDLARPGHDRELAGGRACLGLASLSVTEPVALFPRVLSLIDSCNPLGVPLLWRWNRNSACSLSAAEPAAMCRCVSVHPTPAVRAWHARCGLSTLLQWPHQMAGHQIDSPVLDHGEMCLAMTRDHVWDWLGSPL